jgi:CRP/FNR family transcriptional regulator, anaerobic regulatory protein
MINSEGGFTERLFKKLAGLSQLSGEFRKAVEGETSYLALPKNFMLLQAPKISEHIYFLNEGFAISYTFLQGKKQILSLWKAGEIVMSARSFFERISSEEFIQLAVESEILAFSHASLMRLFNEFPETRSICFKLMYQYYLEALERSRDMQQFDSADRFEKLLRDYPGIQQVLPQEYIASYLGITPQSLSRIKRRSDRS